MAEFDLAKLMKDVSKTDTGKQQIRYIPLDLIDPDPNNFYSLDGLEELAGSIEMIGLQQPLLVRPAQEGRYVVISGHRRREALRKISEGGSSQFADGVPCIVDAGEASEALRELKLIMANADTRKMSSADQNKQAERIEDLLRQLVDEGYVFPGRLRDWVAKLSGMSRTKLARMKMIRDNLDKGLAKKYYAKGKMNEAVAYELAQLPGEMQRRIVFAYLAHNETIEWMHARFVTEYAEMAGKLEKRVCPIASGHPRKLCSNQTGILDKAFDGSCAYKPCKYGHCCNDCTEYLNCRNRCPLLDEKAKAERAEKREASKDQRAIEKARDAKRTDDIRKVWGRFGKALSLAGRTDAELRRELEASSGTHEIYNGYETYIGEQKTADLLAENCSLVKPNDPMPFFNDFKAWDYAKLCAIADALHVSLDYLFLRDDVPDRRTQVVSEADTEPSWNTGNPQCEGRYLCRVRSSVSAAKAFEQRFDWRGGVWTSFGKRIPGVLTVLSWYPLPEEKEKIEEA